MKKLILFFLVFLTLTFSNSNSFSQNYPEYILEVKNTNLIDPNTMVFDLVFTLTNQTDCYLASWQFFFWAPLNLGTFPNGTGVNSSFVLDTSNGLPVTDLPEFFRPRNPNTFFNTSDPFPGYTFRIAGNSLIRDSIFIMYQGVPVLIGRYKMKSTIPIDLSSLNTNPFIFRNSCETSFTNSRTKIGFRNPENNFLTEEITRCANHFVEDNGVLPVELSSFTSLVNKNTVTLNWTTAKETNNNGFDIERSSAGNNNWTKAGFVNGSGTTIETENYAFTESINSGKYNYRLKQIDYNGNFEYFNLSNEIEIGVPNKYRISQNYPNPFNPSTKIDYDLPYDGKVSILLYDISGREVSRIVNDVKTAGYYTVVFNGSDLSSGMYFYRINATGKGNNNFNSTKKMLLIK